jgi:hypothetical protein
MATDPSGVMLKIERADAHLADLKDAIESAHNVSGERFTSEIDPESGQQVYRAHGIPAIDPKWSLIIGELLYNLRSALDHLAWQLVLLDGKTPGKKTQFPIFSKQRVNEDGEPVPAQLRPPVRNPKILAALDECQPYRGADGATVPYRNSPLWQLHRLNIIDKHRLLLVVVCVLNIDNMYWGGDPDMPAPKLKVWTGGVEENTPVAWFDWGVHEPPVEFDPHPSLAVSLNEAAILGSRLTPIPLVDVLGAMCHWVRWDIVELGFRELFPA